VFWKVLLKPGTMRMTAQGMVVFVIIYDQDSADKARHAENDSVGHGFPVNYF
jgi:hypothetical protein